MHSSEASLLYAGYSRHSESYYANFKKGLSFYLFRLQLEGSCKAWIDNRLTPVVPGDLLLYGPGDAYELLIEPNAEGKRSVSADMYFVCAGKKIDEWWERGSFPKKVNISFDESLIHLWRHIVAEKRKRPGIRSELLNSLAWALCLSIEQAVHERTKENEGKETFIAFRMKQYIEKNATEPLTLERIARSVGLSVSRACHLFKAAFGQSMMDYCIEIRMSVAREYILYSSLALERIAELAGFRTYPYFCRAFRLRYGMSPKQYRLSK
ncbi:AraC family transcriptional regulator [Paenibacillus sp. GYB003]|uniref:AraC family transcriptional regulator n=1 Tax=Paenibacillus sp. GYB003 TaxID=2994392 RepID=UPI002F96B688